MKVSIVVPAHDEAGNLEGLSERIFRELGGPEFPHDIELVLVDDNSTDTTGQICDSLAADDARVMVVHRSQDPGFGNAVKAGLAHASGDVLIPFMADLSDDPADIPQMVEQIEAGYDVVYGSRFVPGGDIQGYSPLKLFYNRAYNNLIRLLFGIQSRDITNAFTAYRRDVIDAIDLGSITSESFDLTAELPLRAHIEGFRSTEVPVSWRSREAGASKLNATRKGPVYLTRLLQLFVYGNLIGLRDLFGALGSGSKGRLVGASALGVVILVALFSVSGYSEVFSLLGSVNSVWLLAGATMYLVSFGFRTWRYRVLLRTANHLASRSGVFRAILAGWFVNFILPARAGDAARGLALKTTEGVPFSVATGLTVIERIFDMLVLGGSMILVAKFFLDGTSTTLLALGALAIALVMVIGLVVVYVFDLWVVEKLESRFPEIRDSIEALNEALRQVARNPVPMVLVFLLTVPVWVLEVSTIFFSAQAFGITLTAVSTVTTGIAAFVAQAVPVTPAGIGTYEATITGILSIFGIPASTGTAIGLVDHFTRAAVTYLFGLICIVHIGFQSRVYFRDQHINENRVEAEQID